MLSGLLGGWSVSTTISGHFGLGLASCSLYDHYCLKL
jgi:hypothetical protein